MISVFIDSKFALSQRRSNHLPLKRIETTQIEGTLVLHASVVLEEQEDGSTKRTYVFLHGGLKEYPGILFDYHSSGLGDEIMDVEALAAKKKNDELKPRPGSFSNRIPFRLPEGTKVKIRVRPSDLKLAQSYLVENKNGTQSDSTYHHSQFVKFYELAVGDEIIARKNGLEL